MQEEVVNNYLLWELFKPYIRSLIIHPRTPQDRIEQIIQNNRSKLESENLTFHEKLNRVKSFSPRSSRANYFANFSWTMKN